MKRLNKFVCTFPRVISQEYLPSENVHLSFLNIGLVWRGFS